MIVQTTKGKLQGMRDNGVQVFRGIPFALPPVNDLRWRAPQEVAPWGEVRPAKDFGPACIQPVLPSMDGAEPIGDMSEDCLYLNVWTAHTESGPAIARPVMVWIHGGAYQIGDGISTMYDGSPLAKLGAVVVTFNYRLGHLGFFAHPTLEREVPGAPVNFGLLDQIAALTWVRDNISRFGGDPGNVTIFGSSAGAASVLALFASPLAAGLFHKGIAQSAYALPEHSRAKAVALGADVATRAWGLGKDPTLQQLRGVPESAFALIMTPRAGPHEVRIPVPSLAPTAVHGDPVLPKAIRQTFEDGGQHALPLLLGSNSNDDSVLAAFGLNTAKLLDVLEANVGHWTIAQWKRWYQRDPELDGRELDDRGRLGGLILRDLVFTMQARWLATHHAKLDQPVYRYYFSYVQEARRKDQPRGVAHGGEIVYPFNTGDLAVGTEGTFTHVDRAMADKVSNYWFYFAQNGTPTAGPPGTEDEGVPWPRHAYRPASQTDPTVVLDDRILTLGEAIAPQSNFRQARLDAFAGIYPVLEQAIKDGLG